MSLIIQPKRWSMRPPVGAQIQRGSPLAQGLVGCWLLNEGGGSRLGDLAAANPGSASFGAAAPSWDGRGLLFAGASNTFASTSANISALPVLTVAVRCTPTGANSAYNRIVETSYLTSFYLGTNFNGGNFCWITGGASLEGCIGGTPTTGKESALVGTFDGANRVLWVNGAQVASAAGTAPSAAVPLYFGRFSGGASNAWTGYIASVMIWSRVLSAAEIQLLYCDPYCMMQPQSPQRRYWVVPSTSTFLPAWVTGCNRVIGSGYVS